MLLVDAQIRQRQQGGVPTDYLSVILERGYISQTKLDYRQWLRFSNTSTGAEILTVVQGRLYGKNHMTIMDEQIGDGAKSYREGSLNVTDLLMMTDMLITKVYCIGMLLLLQGERSDYIQHLAQKMFC